MRRTVEGQIDSADYGLPPEPSSGLLAPFVGPGIDENQPYGEARWVLALAAASAVTAAVVTRYLIAAVRRLSFFK